LGRSEERGGEVGKLREMQGKQAAEEVEKSKQHRKLLRLDIRGSLCRK
jgi:hypothetical protein